MVIHRLLPIEAEIDIGNKSRTITTTNYIHLLTPHNPHNSQHEIGGHFAGFDFFERLKSNESFTID